MVRVAAEVLSQCLPSFATLELAELKAVACLAKILVAG